MLSQVVGGKPQASPTSATVDNAESPTAIFVAQWKSGQFHSNLNSHLSPSLSVYTVVATISGVATSALHTHAP